ncbi:MAG: hypothetical protein AVDCRST_MAG73-689, partial [uncultured Thermomicrobiales bacterium]
ATVHGPPHVPRRPPDPGHGGRRRRLPRRRRQERRRRRDLGPLLCQRRQADDVLRIRRPGPGGDPARGRAHRPAGPSNHQGLGPGSLLLPL